MKIVVVGAGVMGLATAASLARGGHEVDVHEQFGLDHTRGSSHGRSRIFRLAYAETHWVELAREALGGWRALEQETGERLLVLDGLLELGETSADALAACGVRWETLEADEVRRRFGVRTDETALFQPEAGAVLADKARLAFGAVAEGYGARLFERSRVRALDEIDADVVVVTAGAWARGLLDTCGIQLSATVTHETVAYFRLRRTVPAVIDYGRGSGALMYTAHDPVHGLKAGVHQAGKVADPDEQVRPSQQLAEEIASWVRERFPDADPVPVELDTCLYTTTADERFVLERHGRIVVGSACSGHGFKFAPAVGARLAALATR